MKKKQITKKVCLLAAIAMPSVASATTIFTNDFESGIVTTSSRLNVDEAGEVLAFSGTGYEITGGVLTNPNTATADGTPTGSPVTSANQGGIFNLVEVGAVAGLAGNTELTVSFDYEVGTASTLFFFAYGYYNGIVRDASGDLTGSTLNNTGAASGSIQSQYTADFSGINLLDATAAGNPNGATATATPLTGNGTFTTTIDLSAFSALGVSSIDDLQLINLAFSSDVNDTSGAGAITIDNLLLEATPVPEPSTSLLALSASGMFLLRRRR